MKVFLASFLASLFVILVTLVIFASLYQVLNTQDKTIFLNTIEESGIIAAPRNGTAITNYSGISWSDYDSDDKIDVLISRGTTALYKNNGNGTFTDVTKASGLENSFSTSGVFGDYDNDGCPDLFLSRPNKLFRNNCGGIFADVTARTGIKDFESARGASWADYDGDGLLDLYVASHGLSEIGDKYLYFSEPNALYRNNGNGTFTNITQRAGVSGAADCGIEGLVERGHIETVGGPYKESFQPIWLDYNSDGKIDLFISTDAGISPLYKNNGGGIFVDVTKEAGLCRHGSGMGAAAADYDNNGHVDIYVTNIGYNYLWHNNGDGTFTEMAGDTKVADIASLGWGTGFFDYNNDGLLDLYVTNGIAQDVTGKVFDGVKLDRLYKNIGGGQFLEISQKSGIGGNYNKEPSAFADFDNNGFPDIFVLSGRYEKNHIYSLYKNQGNTNNWLKVKLVGTKSNRDAIGARIKVETGTGTQLREITSGTSFLSQDSLWQTFGLGTSTAANVEVMWPSGQKQSIGIVNANQTITIKEP
ncbi:MAG: CRTAC1 family protein [Candidatus Curtissbacteria bacterium]